jgi:microcompartment protein CcmL/EutN
MSNQVKISIPASVAAFVRPDTPVQERLRGAEGAVDLPPRELVLLLFCLGKDTDPHVRSLSAATLAALDHGLLLAALDGAFYHPALLHTLALVHGSVPAIRAALLACAELADVTKILLETYSVAGTGENVKIADDVCEGDDAISTSSDDNEPLTDVEKEIPESEEDDEEYFSKYKLAQVMGISEKIKMALSGDKEWRKILIKDANKLVSSGVIKNPRMSEPEVLTLLKSGVQNDEIMRLICANKEWVKNYQIRKALLENPKTPLANALRYLGTMNEKDVATYAKSRNISSVIATQAKRLLMNKKR